MNPFSAWELNLGIETLAVRVREVGKGVEKIVGYLEKRRDVGGVVWPGTPTHPTRDLARKYLKNGFGGILSFSLKTKKEVPEKFFEPLNVISKGNSLGGTKTLIIPSSQKPTPSFYLSIGLENIDDIILDLQQAFSKL